MNADDPRPQGLLWVWTGASTACGPRTENQDRVHADVDSLAVFDGVSGRPLGGVAAATGLGYTLTTMAASRARGTVDVPGALRAGGLAVQESNRRIGLNTATTATVLALYSLNGKGYATVGWVGDTAAFLVRSDGVLRLTVPHVQTQGASEDARRISRWLGDETRGAPDVQTVTILDGDRLIVTSDGVTSVLSEAEIGTTIAAARSPQEAADALIRAALGAETRDNASAAVAFVTGDPRMAPLSAGPLFRPAAQETARHLGDMPAMPTPAPRTTAQDTVEE